MLYEEEEHREDVLHRLEEIRYTPGPEQVRFVYRAIRSDEYKPNCPSMCLRRRGDWSERDVLHETPDVQSAVENGRALYSRGAIAVRM